MRLQVGRNGLGEWLCGTKKGGTLRCCLGCILGVVGMAENSHRGGTGVPPRWNWSPTVVALECHRGGTGVSLRRVR